MNKLIGIIMNVYYFLNKIIINSS